MSGNPDERAVAPCYGGSWTVLRHSAISRAGRECRKAFFGKGHPVEPEGNKTSILAKKSIIALDRGVSHAGARDLHKLIMSFVDDSGGKALDPDTPRASANILWRMDHAALTVQHDPGVNLVVPEAKGRIITSFDVAAPARDNNLVEIEALVARLYQPFVKMDPEVLAMAKQAKQARQSGQQTSSRTTKKVPVPADRLEQWAEGLLQRRNLSVDSLQVEMADDVVFDRRIRRERVPVARITAKVHVDEYLDEIIVRGLGRAKSYGLGLVTVS